jgi:hypothetical protein
MTTITLTTEQEQAIVAHREDQLNKKYTALQRRTDSRVDRANQRANEWRVRYSEARKRLLAALAENTELKRRIREERK